jgi:hypothetical protein
MTVDHLLNKVVRRVVIPVRGLEANARITAMLSLCTAALRSMMGWGWRIDQDSCGHHIIRMPGDPGF